MKKKTETVLVLFALWLMMFSASSQVIIISPILPEIQEALPISATVQQLVADFFGALSALGPWTVEPPAPEGFYGFLITAYAVALSFFALVTGPISDRIGRRRILLIGTACMSGALWLHAPVNTFAGLLGVRTLAGAAGGMLSGAAVAYVGDYFPYERRGWANGWVMSGMAAGQIIGIPVGKLLADTFGFRWPFLMFAITMAGATVLVWRFVPQPDVSRSTEQLTVWGALKGYGRLLKQPAVQAAVAAYFLMFLGIGLFVVYMPTWLEDEIGLVAWQIAALFFVGGLVNVVAGPVAGWFSDQIGRKPLIVASCLGLGLLMLSTTYVIVGMVSAAVLYGLAMITVAMRISPLQSLLTALVSSERRGVLMSLAVGIGQLGIGLGSVLAGFAYAAYGYFSNTVIGAVSMLAMALLVLLALPEPGEEAEAAAGIREPEPEPA